MFDQVLVAMDLSPAADAILRCLPGLRQLGTRALTLAHVAEIDYPVFGAVANLDYHRERLTALAPALLAEGFEVEVIATAGNPAIEILKAAEERGASLVLVGSRSHSRVREAFVGSVAWEVVRRSRIPVLLQRLEPETDQPESRLLASCCDLRCPVLFPTDFSETAERAFAFVEALARLGTRSFTLLHVRGEDEGDGSQATADRERLEARAERLRAAGATAVRVEISEGDPAGEVLRHAAEQPDTLIVMGTHGRGLIAEAVLGSVSREVVRAARASVLLVPGSA